MVDDHMNMEDIYKTALVDLKEDFEELEYLIGSNQYYLSKFLLQLKSVQKYLRNRPFSVILRQTASLNNNLSSLSCYLSNIKKQIADNRVTADSLLKYANLKDECFDLIRSYSALSGSLITSLDWQSPSFATSLYSQAGKQTGKISGTINDYKRDVHLDEQEYEKLYLKEYVDSRFKFGIRTFMTNSGMAAFTTILTFLLAERKLTGKILMGKSVYFQYKQILSGSLGDRIIEVDEMTTEEILKNIVDFQPCAIFLDSLCNAKDIPVPNLEEIINFLIRNSHNDVYLVVDNTCLSVFLQQFKLIRGKTNKVHLIMFESLMKYLHFGLDKVTGGIIIAWGKDTQKIFDYRKHAGTNIADASVYVFPQPNRKMLEKRLRRLQRNALFLAGELQNYIEGKQKCPIIKIIYPGLPNHPAYQWAQNMSFQGSFFNLEFKKKSIMNYKNFIKAAIAEAKKRNIQLVGGTSFGLNNTRVYLTSLWTDYGEPFLRVSAGTENRYQLEILKEVLKSSIDKSSSWW